MNLDEMRRMLEENGFNLWGVTPVQHKIMLPKN